MIIDHAIETVQFLQNLGCQIPYGSSGEFDPSIWDGIVAALERDGLQIVQKIPVQETHYLRRLSETMGGSNLVADLIMVALCVICAGFASGLTQGLLSLDYMEMKIKATSGTPKEKEYASKVLPIISHHHLLLVTLMLWNASATEALPIFLSGLVSEYVAIIISVTLVLMFGEIIPASILTGPKQLQIAANLIPLVYLVFIVFFPIAYPVAKLLDYIIGHDEGMTMYSRREIATMMMLQHEEGVRRASLFNGRGSHAPRDTMQHDEVTIIGGALKFRDMRVREVMTIESNIFMISLKESLSFKTMYEIFKSGYSRIPVYDRDRNDVIGLILAKDLIFVDPEDEIPVENFIALFGRKPLFVWHDELLGNVLASFRQERAHMAIVRNVVSTGSGDPYYVVDGLITLEDIIEEILGTEIEDETDPLDSHQHQLVTHATLQAASAALRDMDLVRFKALRSKITDEVLSEEEIQVIAEFLSQQVPEFKAMISQRIGIEGAKELGDAPDEVSSSNTPRSDNEDAPLLKTMPIVAHDRSSLTGRMSESEMRGPRSSQSTIPTISPMHGSEGSGGSSLTHPPATSTNPSSFSSLSQRHSNNLADERVGLGSISPMPFQPAGAASTLSSALIDAMQNVIRTATVYNLKRQSHPTADKPHADDILYRRGKLSNSCILILQGRVKVLRGQYEDPIILGAWSTLGAQALTVTEGTYVPDFTAYVDSEMLRFIRISTFQSHLRSESGLGGVGTGPTGGEGSGGGGKGRGRGDATFSRSGRLTRSHTIQGDGSNSHSKNLSHGNSNLLSSFLSFGRDGGDRSNNKEMLAKALLEGAAATPGETDPQDDLEGAAGTTESQGGRAKIMRSQSLLVPPTTSASTSSSTSPVPARAYSPPRLVSHGTRDTEDEVSEGRPTGSEAASADRSSRAKSADLPNIADAKRVTFS